MHIHKHMGQKRNSEESQKNFELVDNEDTIDQNVWHAAKAMLKVKYSLNTYIKKEESFKINDLGFCLKKKKEDCIKSDTKEKG